MSDNNNDAMYEEYMAKAKKFGKDGMLTEAMRFLQSAQRFKKTEKVARRIEALQAVIDQGTSSDENDEQVQTLERGMKMDKEIYEKLYPHQREGVQWMWDAVHLGNESLPSNQRIKGGLLSDDMGLGKTIQVAAFIGALLDMGEAHHFLIIVPTSLIPNWEAELRKWVPNVSQFRFSGDIAKKKRERELLRAQTCRSSVVIASYGVCRTSMDVLNSKNGYDWTWPYMILDEAHNIKNASRKSSKAIDGIRSKHRLLLTGTPVMNKLVDFFTLMSVMSQDRILDMNQAHFKNEYQKPIEIGRTKNARSYEVHRANMLSKVLRDKTEFWILRRTKDEVNQKAESGNSGEGPSFPELPPKNDFVLWCKMTRKQMKIYKDFLSSDDVRDALMTKASPLVQCTVLKKICDHPRRMANNACRAAGLFDGSFNETLGNECAANRIHDCELDTLLEESGKMKVLSELVDAIIPEKMLIFSQSIKILDIVAKILEEKDINYMRMDGKDKIPVRDEKVQRFQRDERVKVFMLTTGVGAVGLTLTAATRVIVFDPDWNPSRDDQAVDRAYRIGQVKPVVVFRLITCDTIEEKIYRKQLFKKSIISQNNGENDDPTRLFTDSDIRELFNPPVSDVENMCSETQKALAVVAQKRKVYPQLLELLDKLNTFKSFHAGIHDHDLAFEAPDVQKEELTEKDKQSLRDIAANVGAGNQSVKKYYPKGVDLPKETIPYPQYPPRNPLSENSNVDFSRIPFQKPDFDDLSAGTSSGENSASNRIFGNSHTFVHPTKKEPGDSYKTNMWKKPEPPMPPKREPQEVVSLISSEEDVSPVPERKVYRADNIYTDSPHFNRMNMDKLSTSPDDNMKKRLFKESPPSSPSEREQNPSHANPTRRTKLNMDVQSDDSDDDNQMELEIVGGAASSRINDMEQTFFPEVRPSLNSTMAPPKRIAALIDDDLNESVSNMSIGDDGPFEDEDNEKSPLPTTPKKSQPNRDVSVLDEQVTQRFAPGEFKFDSFDTETTDPAKNQSNPDGTMSGIGDLPQDLDLKQDEDFDSDATADSYELQIDERSSSMIYQHIRETSKHSKSDDAKPTDAHELTTEEASDLLFGGASDSDDSTDQPHKSNYSNGLHASDSQSANSSSRRTFNPVLAPDTQKPQENSFFFESQADVSSMIAETTGEIVDSEEEYNNILHNASVCASRKKKKFKRRSQLPPRPETDDEEDPEESVVEDMDDDMGSFIDDGSEIEEISDDESMEAEDYSGSEDERHVKRKPKNGRVVTLESDDDETPDDLESDEDDFMKKRVRRKHVINSDSDSD